MAFWETMKIWQMGRLLLNRERPDVQEIWGRWRDSILDVINRLDPESMKTNKYQLNALPKAPAAYFLVFVAVLCEKERDIPCLEMDEAGKAYLTGIFDEAPDWKKTIGMVLPRRVPPLQDSPLRCWSRILNYAENFLDTGISTDTKLRELLDRILEANRQASAVKGSEGQEESEERETTEEQEMPEERSFSVESIDHFIRIMNEFDEDWQRLTRKYAAPNQTVEMLGSLIQDGIRQIILTGAPGTGKTHAAMETARHLSTGSRIRTAQFHPSYDYTDFVEGLRPVQMEGEAKSTFVRLDGSFKAFCRHVAEENRQRASEDERSELLYFFLIDEINRANLSQVFGELMFCLESDKRDRPVETQYRNLPVYRIGGDQKAAPMEDDIFSGGFFVPKNVVIIGTMNDIDRSVESMDFALRRRFIWHEVRVDKELLKEAFESGNFGELLRINAEETAGRVMDLNAVIEKAASLGLNRHYDISQGQFSLPCPSAETLEELILFVWKHRIEPLLREYVRGESQEDVEAFLRKCAEALKIRNADSTGSEVQEEV